MKHSHFSTLGRLTGHGGEACVLQDLCLPWLGGRSSPKRRLMHVESVEAIRGPVPVEVVCLKTYASGVLLLEGPPKPDWSRVTGQTGDSSW